MKLEKIKRSEFDGIYAEMEKNFVYEERRDKKSSYALLDKDEYSVYHIVDGDLNVGFITLWQLDGAAFIEHFVTYEKYRCLGYGAKTLELLKGMFARLVLEAEMPTDELRARRVAFYKRCGFFANDILYVQPSYHGNGGIGVDMILMSYPAVLEDFDATVSEILRCVYNI